MACWLYSSTTPTPSPHHFPVNTSGSPQLLSAAVGQAQAVVWCPPLPGARKVYNEWTIIYYELRYHYRCTLQYSNWLRPRKQIVTGDRYDTIARGTLYRKDVHYTLYGKDVHGTLNGKDIHDTLNGKDAHDTLCPRVWCPWFQDDCWEAPSHSFQSSFSKTGYLEEVLASIPL